jgi:hypothetical protein
MYADLTGIWYREYGCAKLMVIKTSNVHLVKLSARIQCICVVMTYAKELMKLTLGQEIFVPGPNFLETFMNQGFF